MATSLEGSHDDGMKPLFDLILQPRAAADGRGRPVPPARHHPRGQSLSRPHPHRPHHLGLGQAEPGREGARPRRQAGRDRPRHQGAGLPRPRARAGRRGRRPATSSPSPGCRTRPSPTPSAHPEVETPIPAQPIDPPTLAMTFRVNDSPLAGTEGDKVTGRMIRDRLLREAEGNVALRVRESDDKDSMEVAGRGELQLGILIETMRREGFELSVSRPKVLLRRNEARRAGRADRRGRDRRRRGAFRRRRAEDVGAQGRDDRDAPVRRPPRRGWCSTRRRAA